MTDAEYIEKCIAADFCSALVGIRKNLGLSLLDIRNCILDPKGDLGILNVLCRRFENVFCARTMCFNCFVGTSDDSFQDFSFSYFPWYDQKEIFWTGRIKLVTHEMPADPTWIKLHPTKSWLEILSLEGR